MALRPATADDWAAMTGLPAPGEWFGYVEGRAHLIEGLGAIYLAGDGRWWITFQRCPGVGKVKTAHAGAKRLLAESQERGVTVHALAQPGMPGADMWLERLGFAMTGQELEGVAVWQTR